MSWSDIVTNDKRSCWRDSSQRRINMAGRPDVKRDKMVKEFIHIVLAVNLLNIILPCKATLESHGQGEVFYDL